MGDMDPVADLSTALSIQAALKDAQIANVAFSLHSPLSSLFLMAAFASRYDGAYPTGGWVSGADHGRAPPLAAIDESCAGNPDDFQH